MEKDMNKSMLTAVIFCAVLQSNIIFCSEGAAPSYWQQLKNYVVESRVGRSAADMWDQLKIMSGRPAIKKTVEAAGMGALSEVTIIEPTPVQPTIDYLLKYSLLVPLVLPLIGMVWNNYNKGSLSEAVAVAQIKEIINSRLLKKCHTNKEKLELLAHRDYFTAKFKTVAKTDKEFQSQKALSDKVFAQLVDQVETEEAIRLWNEQIAKLSPEDRAKYDRAVEAGLEKIKGMSLEELLESIGSN
jgi:hypothetical protein